MHALQPLVAQRGLGLSGRVPQARVPAGFFLNMGYGTWRGTSELRYVDWQVAVRRIHDMYTDEIPWDIRALVEFARLSAGQVHDELRHTYPDEEFPGGRRERAGPPGAP